MPDRRRIRRFRTDCAGGAFNFAPICVPLLRTFLIFVKHNILKTDMRLKEGFVLREVDGKKIVLGEGLEQVDFNKLVVLNPAAAYLWESVEGTDFDAAALTRLLTARYDLDAGRAQADAEALLEEWRKLGMVE